MPKRKETIELENALIKETREKRLYGCEEITIGFANNGHGNEIVDFMTMDSKGIIKCYELKVTKQDLRSDAAKSWYGNYNYLVISSELYDSITDIRTEVPDGVGVIVGYLRKDGSRWLESVKKSKRSDMDHKTEIMLKESMIRSMYWKMDKYKDAQSLEKQKKLNAEIRKIQKEKDSCYKRALKAEKIITDYEIYKAHNDNVDNVDLYQMAKEEKEKYEQRRKGGDLYGKVN